MTIGFADGGRRGATDGSTPVRDGGVGDPCGNLNPGCVPGLDCAYGFCRIPPHSPIFRCGSALDCEDNAQGGGIICEERICCNTFGGSCAVENDCCTGDLCVGGICRLETDHGFCSTAYDCASGVCDPSTFCGCLADRAASDSYRKCCSGQLNAAGTACGTRTLGLACPATACSPNTEQCVTNACCITSIGSKIEPCSRNLDCCQAPFPLTCIVGTCCNLLDGLCTTNDDCCVSMICNASAGITGFCKYVSGVGPCFSDADCISDSCDISTHACN
jgi:hypothetical protein